jgi:ATP-dependent Lon protease
MFIYLDESGDLGFNFSKRKTTSKFVITLMVCNSEIARKELRKAVRRTLKNKLNRKKKKSWPIEELKGINTTLEIKKYFFRNVRDDSWDIYTLVLNKARVEPHLQTKIGKKKLYNFLSRILMEKVNLTHVQRNVDLIVDRCKNKEEVRDFNQYLINQLEALLPLNTDLNISHLTSQESAGLQVVDLFSWGIFRKYENNDYEWYNVYRHKVRFETEYLR